MQNIGGTVVTQHTRWQQVVRVLVAIALRWGLNPNDLKLITALFVFAALVLPGFIERCKRRPTSAT